MWQSASWYAVGETYWSCRNMTLKPLKQNLSLLVMQDKYEVKTIETKHLSLLVLQDKHDIKTIETKHLNFLVLQN